MDSSPTIITKDFPDLPLTCLETAEETTTHKVVKSTNTVIDFWTTKCTRCPAALDKLDAMASNEEYQNVQFLSICCDSLDGAREIIEETDTPKWNNMHHYFMDHASKEQAKKSLGFKAVPFYVVFNESGEMVMKGNSKSVDFDKIPGKKMRKLVTLSDNKENIPPKSLAAPVTPSPTNKPKVALKETPKVMQQKHQSPTEVERVFEIEELDF